MPINTNCKFLSPILQISVPYFANFCPLFCKFLSPIVLISVPYMLISVPYRGQKFATWFLKKWPKICMFPSKIRELWEFGKKWEKRNGSIRGFEGGRQIGRLLSVNSANPLYDCIWGFPLKPSHRADYKALALSEGLRGVVKFWAKIPVSHSIRGFDANFRSFFWGVKME